MYSTTINFHVCTFHATDTMEVIKAGGRASKNHSESYGDSDILLHQPTSNVKTKTKYISFLMFAAN